MADPDNDKNPDEAAVTIEADDLATTPKKSKKAKRERPPLDPTDPAVIAERAAAHNANAAKEAAAAEALDKANATSKLDECKYYTSLTLGTLCIVSVFAFLFLVPFVLDPAVSTLTHDFVERPVTCKVTNVSVNRGKSNCLWSSCREGCTADMYHCYQVRVSYSHVPFRNGTKATDIGDWVDLQRYDTIENKVGLFLRGSYKNPPKSNALRQILRFRGKSELCNLMTISLRSTQRVHYYSLASLRTTRNYAMKLQPKMAFHMHLFGFMRVHVRAQ